jgi:hypothetical protein
MDKYIKQLLELYSKIILPQFGAIVIENEETGELMFNEYLSYDDGKLSALIEKESNMELQEAQNMVAKFVRELQLQLDKGETYTIFQLGEFSKNADGEFTFTGNLKTGFGENVSTSAGSAPEKPAPIVTPVVSEEKENTPDDAPDKKEEKPEIKNDDAPKKNTYVEKKESFPKSDSDQVKKAEPKQETKKEKPVKVKKEKVKKVKKEKVVVPPKVKTPKPPKKAGDKKEKRKRSPFLWIVLVLLLLVAAGSTYVGLNYDKVEEFMGWNKFDAVEKVEEKTEKETLPIEEEVIQEETEAPIEEENVSEEIIEKEIVEEEVVEEKPKKEKIVTPITQTSTGNHHIIVGCFSELSNAQGLVNDFKQQGFDSKIIGQYGGLHFVSAQSYPSSSEAASNLSRVKSIKDGAWIFRK